MLTLLCCINYYDICKANVIFVIGNFGPVTGYGFEFYHCEES